MYVCMYACMYACMLGALGKRSARERPPSQAHEVLEELAAASLLKLLEPSCHLGGFRILGAPFWESPYSPRTGTIVHWGPSQVPLIF